MTTRVLVIDDVADVMQALVDLFRSELPCEVAGASSFAEGLVMAQGLPWDVVVCDGMLPGGSGCQILSLLAQKRPATRRVLMTAYSNPALIARAVNDARADLYLQKPFDPAELVRDIGGLLEVGGPRRATSFGRIPLPPRPL